MTTTSKYNKSQIMKRAWNIYKGNNPYSYSFSAALRRAWRLFRSTGKTFAVCLSKAWALWRLTRLMRAGVVRFAYEKADGSLRKACGTLHNVASTVKGVGRPDDGQTVKYYDVEAGGWRSFRVENFVTAY